MLGFAVTVRIRCSSPPSDGHHYLDRTDWWDFIESIAPPRVIVFRTWIPHRAPARFSAKSCQHPSRVGLRGSDHERCRARRARSCRHEVSALRRRIGSVPRLCTHREHRRRSRSRRIESASGGFVARRHARRTFDSFGSGAGNSRGRCRFSRKNGTDRVLCFEQFFHRAAAHGSGTRP